MSDTANVNAGPKLDDPVVMNPLASDEPVKPKTNNDRKAEKLQRQIQHKFDYSLSVYAQMLLKVKKMQDELVNTCGYAPVELIKPDFDDPELLELYAERGNYRG